MQNDGMDLKSGTDLARKILQDSRVEHDLTQLIGQSRLNILDEMSSEGVVDLIASEILQTQAIVLAHIDARKSFRALEILAPKLRSQVLLRISKLEPISSSFLDELNRYLKEKIEKNGG
jgi:flagellar motor switch protein FliG